MYFCFIQIIECLCLNRAMVGFLVYRTYNSQMNMSEAGVWDVREGSVLKLPRCVQSSLGCGDILGVWDCSNWGKCQPPSASW